MKIRYFDNAATTKVSEEVMQAMIPYLKEEYGNPSSMYTKGRSAKTAIEKARKQVASLLNCNPNEIIFTSCGSESDNTALKGIAKLYKEKGNHIITSKIEHPAILESCKALEKEGCEITYLNVNKDGIIDLEELKKSIKNNTILISIMTANNEIGTIEPISQIAKIAKENNVIFHTDAVQAVGNIPIDVQSLGVDMLSLSGHKIHAPKGVGALYVKKGIVFERFLDGGHQEKNKRAGTENVSGIVGLGKACEIAEKNLRSHIQYLQEIRKYFIIKLQNSISNISINGTMESRLPGNLNISFKGVEGETILLKLDQKGICASSGSACSSGDTHPSHVLKAIGLSDEMAQSTLRFSFDEENTKEDIDYLLTNLVQIVESLRKI